MALRQFLPKVILLDVDLEQEVNTYLRYCRLVRRQAYEDEDTTYFLRTLNDKERSLTKIKKMIEDLMLKEIEMDPPLDNRTYLTGKQVIDFVIKELEKL